MDHQYLEDYYYKDIYSKPVTELKSCPFCDGEAEIIRHHGWEVVCKKCNVLLYTDVDNKQKVIDAWNKREGA